MRSQSKKSTLPPMWKFTLFGIGDYADQLRQRVIVEETESFLCIGASGIVSGLRRP